MEFKAQQKYSKFGADTVFHTNAKNPVAAKGATNQSLDKLHQHVSEYKTFNNFLSMKLNDDFLCYLPFQVQRWHGAALILCSKAARDFMTFTMTCFSPFL